MSRLFGTDGVRGVANTDLTPELALSLGRALVAVLIEEGHTRPSILIGRDPRWSGELLEAALAAGITSAGGNALTVGVIPTPGVAYLTTAVGAAAGAMISASHNPVGDNGIKFFGGDGYKLRDDEEDRLEELIGADGLPRPSGTDVGRIIPDHAAVLRYIDHLVNTADTDLGGMRVVLDGANGSASEVAPQVYRRLGATVIDLNCKPDGANINDGVGSTHPEVVCKAVVQHSAELGISHDGDADRLIAADARGNVVDGDAILAILARDRQQRDVLAENTVVTTVMTNLGFKRAMQGLGIDVVETAVGDRYVLEDMRGRGAVLGGEQSGHIIQLDKGTTGDGILSAVALMGVVKRSEATLHDLAQVMTRLPQVLINVPDVDKGRLDATQAVWDAVAVEEGRLGDDGRVLVRPSGTEPVIRVMVEAMTQDDAHGSAERIADVIRDTLAI